jgi:phosphoglycolate phosphatase-like HAD superfamily hydrolase
MGKKAVLFDIENLLVREAKDVSTYYFEAIRSSYGLSIDDIKLSDYQGMTVQEKLMQILTTKGNLSRDEILEKRDLFMEELPYAHYNVAGHDKAILFDGAKDTLKRFNDKGYIVASASGQLERILNNLFHRADLNYTDIFKCGTYGSDGETMHEIINGAIGAVGKQFEIDKPDITFVGPTKEGVESAKAAGINAVGVMSDPYSRKELEGLTGSQIVKSVKDCEKFIK